MNIAGIGLIFSDDRGITAYRERLQSGWAPPTMMDVPFQPSPVPAYSVSPDTLKDKALLRPLRRADRFSKMSVLAASDALADAALDDIPPHRLGLILGTALGPHVTTFRFLDDILQYGDKEVSPTTFSNSVHNAAASYIARVLDVRGPTLTLTDFHFSIQQALLIAQCWLRENRCDRVLVGTTDELGTVMQYAYGEKRRTPDDGKVRPFEFSSDPAAIPGEGSVFFLLTPGTSPNAYARIQSLSGNTPDSPVPDIELLDTDGILADESPYLSAHHPEARLSAYNPLFGSILSGTSFHCATAALMLKEQTAYQTPVPDNPFGKALVTETASCPMQNVYCTKLNCYNSRVTIHLETLT